MAEIIHTFKEEENLFDNWCNALAVEDPVLAEELVKAIVKSEEGSGDGERN